MSELSDRLRELADLNDCARHLYDDVDTIDELRQAADELDRLQSTLAEIEALALWHCDEGADPLDTSPVDQVAHTNGLIVRLCRKVRISQ